VHEDSGQGDEVTIPALPHFMARASERLSSRPFVLRSTLLQRRQDRECTGGKRGVGGEKPRT
jgi:hypothetical protein